MSHVRNVWNTDTAHIPLLTPISLLIDQHLSRPEDRSEDSIGNPAGNMQDQDVPPAGHHHIIIHTGYDPQHPDNCKDLTSFNSDEHHKQCKAWMEFQRSKAAKAVEISDVDDLWDRVSAGGWCCSLLMTST